MVLAAAFYEGGAWNCRPGAFRPRENPKRGSLYPADLD